MLAFITLPALNSVKTLFFDKDVSCIYTTAAGQTSTRPSI
jgi:hypothetical protein